MARTKKTKRRGGTMKKYQAGRWRPTIAGFPDMYPVNLRFCMPLELTCGTGVPGQHTLKGNGLDRPNLSDPSDFKQCLGYDQLEAIYERYYVISSSIKVKIASSIAKGVRVVVAPQYNQPTTLDLSVLAERPRAKQTFVSNSDGIQTIYNKASSLAITGERRNKDFYALTATQPNAIWYWLVAAQAIDDPSTATVIDMSIELNYKCQFFNRRPLTSSGPEPI